MKRTTRPFIAALSVLAAIAATPAAACQLATVTDIPVRFADGRPMVTASLNGREVEFLLDTGSATSTVYRSSALRSGMEFYEVDHSHDVSGSERGREEWAYTTHFGVGSLNTDRVAFRVTPPPRQDAARVVGVLGVDFLQSHLVELDFGHGLIRLLKASGCIGDDELYWGGAYSALSLNTQRGWSVSATVNGKGVTAVIDSGAAQSSLDPETTVTLGLPASGRPRAVTLDTLTLDQETIRGVKLGVAENPASAGLSQASAPPPGDARARIVLGADFLRGHRVLISPSERRVYITHNAGPGFVE